MNNDEVLCHYGVLGMKWGRRKEKANSQESSYRNRHVNHIKKISTSYKNRKSKKTSIKNVSNEDLQSKIKRLEMEKRYRDLKKDEVSSGRKLAGEILRSSAKSLGVGALTTVGAIAIKQTTGLDIRGKKKK